MIPIIHCQISTSSSISDSICISFEVHLSILSLPPILPSNTPTLNSPYHGSASHQTAPTSGLWSHHFFLLALWPRGGGGFLLLLIWVASSFHIGFLGLPTLAQPVPSINAPLFFLTGQYLISSATHTADRNIASAHEIVFSLKLQHMQQPQNGISLFLKHICVL